VFWKKVKTMTELNKCGRADELVSYVYNEATQDERRSFEQHLTACNACRDELTAFGEVRGAVREWHEEIMQGAPALALETVVPQFARNGRPVNADASIVAPVVASRRTAWDALREFFTLTPAWARVGMVAASLVVCALAVLAIVNAQFRWDDKGIAFGTGVNKRTQTAPQAATAKDTTQVATNNAARFTQADFDKVAAERDAAQRELMATRKQLDAAQQQVNVLNASLANSQAAYKQTLATLRTTRANQMNGSRRGNRFGPQMANLDQDDEGLRLSDLLDEVSAGREQPQVKKNEQ
jgi:hypothetical protein